MKIDTQLQTLAASQTQAKPSVVAAATKPETTQTAKPVDRVEISPQGRLLAAQQVDSASKAEDVAAPKAPLAIPAQPSAEEASGQAEEKRAPERAVAQRQVASQAGQSSINLLA